MANKHMKIYSISIIIREVPIKTTVGYHLAVVIMAVIKKTTNNNFGKVTGQKVKMKVAQ